MVPDDTPAEAPLLVCRDPPGKEARRRPIGTFGGEPSAWRGFPDDGVGGRRGGGGDAAPPLFCTRA